MTTNLELIEMAKKMRIRSFRNVYMKDELKNIKPLEKESMIVNFETSSEGGSHWFAIHKNGNDIKYFDSYGTPKLKEVIDYYKGYEVKHFQSYDGKYPDKPVQELGTSVCGQLSILFLRLCDMNFEFKNIIKILSP